MIMIKDSYSCVISVQIYNLWFFNLQSCTFVSEIDEIQQEALDKFKEQLSQLQLNSMLRGLLKRQIFTKTLNFEVMKTAPPGRVARLLEILRTRGARAFRAFCEILKEDCEVELAYGLQKEAYKKEVEIFWWGRSGLWWRRRTRKRWKYSGGVDLAYGEGGVQERGGNILVK